MQAKLRSNVATFNWSISLNAIIALSKIGIYDLIHSYKSAGDIMVRGMTMLNQDKIYEIKIVCELILTAIFYQFGVEIVF